MVGDALDTDTGHEQDSITQVSEFVTSAPPHETTTHKPQPEEADICHSRTLACEIIPENHYFIQTVTVLPLRRMAHSTKLSRMASVADRPGVDKFTVRSTTTKVLLDRCVNLVEASRKVRAPSQPSSSQCVQYLGVNVEKNHELPHTYERKLHAAS